GSLRDAINQVNAGLYDTIEFDIPGTGPFTIQPVCDLPSITQPVLIDGYSQMDASPNSMPIDQPNNAQIEIEIRGPGAGLELAGPLNGLVLDVGSDGSTIRGLCIDDFANYVAFTGGSGVIMNSTNNRIEGCFIGSDPSGSVSRACFNAIV